MAAAWALGQRRLTNLGINLETFPKLDSNAEALGGALWST